MMDIMEDFIHRSEHEKIDKHLVDHMFKFYEQFERLEAKEEKTII